MKWVLAAALGALSALAMSGGAAAQPSKPVAPHTAEPSQEIPWYERFTSPGIGGGVGAPSAASGLGPLAPPSETVRLEAGGKWGLSVSSRQEPPAIVVTGPNTESSVMAFFKFSPRFQLNGRVSVGEVKNTVTGKPVEPSNSVKIESVFKF